MGGAPERPILHQTLQIPRAPDSRFAIRIQEENLISRLFGDEGTHDRICEPVGIEALAVGKENDRQVGIDEMRIFDHAGANVKNHAVAV